MRLPDSDNLLGARFPLPRPRPPLPLRRLRARRRLGEQQAADLLLLETPAFVAQIPPDPRVSKLIARLIEIVSDMSPHLRELALCAATQAALQTSLREPNAPDMGVLLSRQEQRVLGLLVEGRSNPEIAQELVVSVNTIKTQLKQIYRKLGVVSRQEACAVARHWRSL